MGINLLVNLLKKKEGFGKLIKIDVRTVKGFWEKNKLVKINEKIEVER